MKNLYLYILFILVFFNNASTQDVLINEVMSSNAVTIQDGDGDFPDWIELFNRGTDQANLEMLALSDDPASPLKWQFPAVTMPPQSYLLVFASGKDKKDWVAEWETVIDQGDACRFLSVDTIYNSNWILPAFDDHDWQQGPTGVGYGDGDDATIIGHTQCLYLRLEFQLEDVSIIRKMLLHVDFDDAFVAYLNGHEIARSNIGVAGDRPDYDTMPDTYREALMYQGGDPLQFELDEQKLLLQSGRNLLAIEVHNYGASSSDMSIIPFLSLGYSTHKEGSRGVNPVLKIPASNLHTNFKIKASGEPLLLSSASGQVIDSFFADSIPADISKGRYPDGDSSWYYYDSPTPGLPNGSDGYRMFCPSVRAGHPSGFYSMPFLLRLYSDLPNSKIFYTTDGSFPEQSDKLYVNPIPIEQTTVIRARIYKDGAMPGPVLSSTYFVNEESGLPVISLITEPAYFWDKDSGIYVKGPNASADFPFFGANFWQDWEREAHIEFFEENGSGGFSAGCGVKIFGGWTRGYPQKSLSVFFRGRYGSPILEYQLFPGLDIDHFEALVLRNSGNDWEQTMLRDGMMSSLLSETDVDYQACRPAVLFINGQYWGIHNIREKVNEHFIAAHHSVPADQIDMLENNQDVIHGDKEHYQRLTDYITSHDMDTPESFDFVRDQMDINEFFDYVIAEIYFDNTDWPGNNIKYWRHKTITGKWHWILYDTDFGFGLFDEAGYRHNTLAFALAGDGPEWPNPPWSTLLLRRILDNSRFREQFINYFADHLNLTFSVDRVLAHLSGWKAKIEDEIPAHKQRWSQDASRWEGEMERLYTFARYRVVYCRAYLMQEFNLGPLNMVTIQLSDSAMGKIELNHHLLIDRNFEGYYFPEIRISLKAIAAPGCRFAGWSGSHSSKDDEIQLFPYGNINLLAHFEQAENPANGVVINEINYNSAETFDSGDWLEFINSSGQDVNMSRWVFKDSDDSHQFVFPEGFILERDSCVVLVNSEQKFREKFPEIQNYLSGMDFGLSGSGELVRLYNANMELIDSLVYDDKAPWPEQADGKGATLELLNPERDNALAQNWDASAGHGSPGKENSVYTDVATETKTVIPAQFELAQNFPNPFNSETKICYTVSRPGFVSLSVYDLQGRKVAVPDRGYRKAGQYEVLFDGTAFSSGIYFYQISINSKLSGTRKMILIR